MLYHSVANDLRGPLVITDHNAFVQVDAFRLFGRSGNRNTNHVEIGRPHRADTVRRCHSSRQAAGLAGCGVLRIGPTAD